MFFRKNSLFSCFLILSSLLFLRPGSARAAVFEGKLQDKHIGLSSGNSSHSAFLTADLCSQTRFTSSSRIKLERKRRKVLESTPDLLLLTDTRFFFFFTSVEAASQASSKSRQAISDYLIRGPPSCC
ncbi:MAG: hypothetical protein ACHQRM_04790 [Bacteroidia bacterium]